ncbi:MAG: hypothetical protein ACI4LO_07350, partial [Anaerovoracaceae bacterium]
MTGRPTDIILKNIEKALLDEKILKAADMNKRNMQEILRCDEFHENIHRLVEMQSFNCFDILNAVRC